MATLKHQSTILLLASILSLSACSYRDCDPITPWINGSYDVWVIEGVPKWHWFDNKLNVSGQDLISSGISVDIGSWGFTFEPNGKWHSSISGLARKGLFNSFNFYISFSGSFSVTETSYELTIEDINKKVGSLDVSPIIDFMRSQTTGSWSMDYDLCSVSPKLSNFGKFKVY